ncbi:hypothetical protein CNMCM5793_007331 [Aspergillus hiratsukae]|uniref:Uncharacterized protein n=1 Tax=Aspergillus hiratsukae TaxID=1194566 RepID=A0A8H6QG07_9EURO|nr:hypothetical protein CNMCM5793_007331 [Aspergillus hiratsukae]KAF7172980.1 hypothetical protein CNMCM6106_007108 [Aspergillus hiratsukae]
MAIDILPLTKADIPDAVVCIQKAFADDPYFRWVFDMSKFNITRNAASLTAHFLHGLNVNAPIYIAKYRPSPTDKHPPPSSPVHLVDPHPRLDPLIPPTPKQHPLPRPRGAKRPAIPHLEGPAGAHASGALDKPPGILLL